MPSLQELARSLQAYDPIDLAAGVGALHLMPENADHIYRLDFLAGVVASVPAGTGADAPRMSSGHWRGLMNQSPIAGSHVVSQEDPFEEPFTQSVSFYGGSYTVVSGMVSGDADAFRRLSEALLLVDGGVDEPLRTEAQDLAVAVLGASRLITDRAGLGRITAPEPGGGKPCVIPATTQFDRLKNAVRITWHDLSVVLSTAEVDALKVLTTAPGSLRLPDTSGAADPRLYMAPIIDFGDEFVAVLPGSLLTAFRHRIIVRAGELGMVAPLASAFQVAAARSVRNSLETMAYHPLPLEVPDSSVPGPEIFARFDDHAIAQVMILTDPLENYDEADPFGNWDTEDLRPLATDRITEVREWIRSQPDLAGDRLLHIVITEGVGRSLAMGLANPIIDDRAQIVHATCRDLGVIARDQAFDPLALWKFARSLNEAEERTRIVSFSILDTYALYVDRDRSFQLDEGRPADLLTVQVAYGLKLRIADESKRDLHGELNTTEHAVRQVERLYTGSSIPIYASPVTADSAWFFIEGAALPIWVDFEGDADAVDRQLAVGIGSMVAYWLWQLLPVLTDSLRWLGARYPQLLVTLIIDPAQDRRDTSIETGDWVTASPNSRAGLSVRFSSATLQALGGPDNSGERGVVRVLLRAIGDLANERDVMSEAAVDTVAPLGQKRIVPSLRSESNPELQPGPIPPFRLLDPADSSRRLDELGAWMSDRISVGLVPKPERVALLGDVVEFFYTRLQEAVAPLSPDGLLEFLVLQNEALVLDEARWRLTIPTRIACFGVDAQIVKEAIERNRTRSLTSIANRFLIEYVTTIPPTGALSIDLMSHSLILSLAAEMVNMGLLSDAIHYGLSDADLEHPPSGRLRVSRGDRFDLAHEQFLPLFADGQIRSAKDHYDRNWRVPSSDPPLPDELARLDSAFQQEFGFSADELTQLVGLLRIVANDQDTEPAVLSHTELLGVLTDELGWDARKGERALQGLSLQPRDVFLTVLGTDVYPWRFSRSLSYMSRPLLRRGEGSPAEYVWGVRHVFRSGYYILDLCTSGRMHATSREMKHFISDVRRREPLQFNKEVAKLLSADANLVVRERVRKFAGMRIQRNPAQDLGDIDVLVADLRRRRITAIEVKDLELARTPAELAQEAEKLFVGPRSADSLHHERVQWLTEHKAEVVAWLDLPEPPSRWRVDGLIVVSRQLLGPLLREGTFPVMTVRQMAARFGLSGGDVENF